MLDLDMNAPKTFLLDKNSLYYVILACRNQSRAQVAVQNLKIETENENVSFMILDLASLQSVRDFVSEITKTSYVPLFGLVNNAGIGAAHSDGSLETVDHFELIFGTNHLGHFLLTNLLLPHLVSNARITNVSSDMHSPPRDFVGGDIFYPGAESLAYRGKIQVSPLMRYGMSKLCNVYFTYELVKRLNQAGKLIHVNAFNPGLMLDTDFGKGDFLKSLNIKLPKGLDVSVSGRQLAELAIDEVLNGKYVNKGVEQKSSELSYDLKNAEDLWEISKRLSNLSTTI